MLKIRMILFRIDQGRAGFSMAHQGLKPVERHTATEAAGGESVAKFVGEDMHAGAGCDLRDLVLQGLDAHPMMRVPDRDEKGVIIIRTGFKVFSERKL